MTQYLRIGIVLLLLAGLSALLCYLCFPPADLGLLAWIALVPLFYALGLSAHPWQGGLIGLAYGMVFFTLLMGYISMFGLLPWVLLALFQGLFFAIFGWVSVYLRRISSVLVSGSAMAAAWVLVEYLRSHVGPLSFTFGDLAYSQHALLPIIQLASLLGAGAVTFVIILANAVLARALLQLRRPTERPDGHRPHQTVARSVAAVYGLIGVIYVSGAAMLSWEPQPPAETEAISVGLVQGNVNLHTPVTPEDAEQCRQTYTRLTRRLPPNLDLVVWPETALPVVLNRDSEYQRSAEQVARRQNASLLTGALEESAGGEVYNTAYLFDPDGKVVGKYRKMHLVMFGEYVPGRDRLKFLSRYPIRRFDFIPGRKRELMSVRNAPFGVLICFEAIFSGPTRQLCKKGAQLLVFITSDVWAIGTPEVLQHSYTAPLRAVEARKYVVRAATMGQSALISPYGKVLREIPVATAGTTEGEVHPCPKLSIYHRLGDVPLLALCLLLWLVAMFSRKSVDRIN